MAALAFCAWAWNASIGIAGTPRDQLWCRFRGPAHGRAHVPAAPAPPLAPAWKINLWDPNGDGEHDDCILFDTRRPAEEASPLGLGIAWRADEDFLYAFETGFFTTGKRFAVFDRHTGKLLDRATDAASRPLADKRVVSVCDDPGPVAADGPLIFLGGYFPGQTLYTVERANAPRVKIRPLDLVRANMFGKLFGPACEGVRWLAGPLYLNGDGAEFEDSGKFRWGGDLMQWRRRGRHRIVVRDISVPAAAWNDRHLVLFARGGLTGRTARATFAWGAYMRIGFKEGLAIVERTRRVSDAVKPTGEDLLEDLPIRGRRGRMTNQARNAVRALAISPNGQWVYCHERPGPAVQRIVRRDIGTFRIDGRIEGPLLPAVRRQGMDGQANYELGIGFALDEKRFYLHTADRLTAYTPELDRQLYSVRLPARTLDAHCPYAMNRLTRGTNRGFAARGTENTIATDGRCVYLTTDTTFQVHDAATGKALWTHTFADLPFHRAVRTVGREERTLIARALPGDVILTDTAVYVATHGNQSALYCFKRAADVEE